MEQKDYILREIEKISVLILGMLGKLNRESLPHSEKSELPFDDLKKEFEGSTGLDLEKIIDSSDLNFSKMLRKEDGFDENNIELLADLLAAIELDNKERENELKRTARNLYEYLNIHSRTYSYQRVIKIGRLKEAD